MGGWQSRASGLPSSCKNRNAPGGSGGGNGGSLGEVGGEGNGVWKYARTKPKGSFINDVTQRGGVGKENFRDVIYECPLNQCQCPTLNYSC